MPNTAFFTTLILSLLTLTTVALPTNNTTLPAIMLDTEASLSTTNTETCAPLDGTCASTKDCCDPGRHCCCMTSLEEQADPFADYAGYCCQRTDLLC